VETVEPQHDGKNKRKTTRVEPGKKGISAFSGARQVKRCPTNATVPSKKVGRLMRKERIQIVKKCSRREYPTSVRHDGVWKMKSDAMVGKTATGIKLRGGIQEKKTTTEPGREFKNKKHRQNGGRRPVTHSRRGTTRIKIVEKPWSGTSLRTRFVPGGRTNRAFSLKIFVREELAARRKSTLYCNALNGEKGGLRLGATISVEGVGKHESPEDGARNRGGKNSSTARGANFGQTVGISTKIRSDLVHAVGQKKLGSTSGYMESVRDCSNRKKWGDSPPAKTTKKEQKIE